MYRSFSNGSNDIKENLLEKRQRDRGLLSISGALNITIPWVKGLKAQIKTDVVQNTSNYVDTVQPFYGSSSITYPSGKVAKEPQAMSTIVNGLSSFLGSYGTLSSSDYTDLSMPGFMIARDAMCEDFPVSGDTMDYYYSTASAGDRSTDWAHILTIISIHNIP